MLAPAVKVPVSPPPVLSKRLSVSVLKETVVGQLPGSAFGSGSLGQAVNKSNAASSKAVIVNNFFIMFTPLF